MQDMMQKLEILTDGAKYDVACTSSGADSSGTAGLGSKVPAGICHSFSADGRCISLLKVLMTNYCAYDCQYCVNRRSSDVPRSLFSPRELSELVIAFYRRNYIEGLFLSSGVLKNPDYTMELMCETLYILRNEYGFGGYIHAKTIPGASPALITRLGHLADRISVNLELPSEQSLGLFAPDKPRQNILKPMGFIRNSIEGNREELTLYRHATKFAPAGQSTQMIIGASPDTDWQIINLAESLYRKYRLRRVFYSAYIPVAGSNALLPQNQPVPLLREHRLYQADFLLRQYGFAAAELLGPDSPHLDPLLDPKCQWALRNLHHFPVEINRADLELLLRIPGIGPSGARKIITARKSGPLHFEDLKKLRIVLKRAVYFITCSGRMMPGVQFDTRFIYRNLVADTARAPDGSMLGPPPTQLSLYHPPNSIALPAPQSMHELFHRKKQLGA